MNQVQSLDSSRFKADILLVDDHLDNNWLLSEMLVENGFKTHTVLNWKLALNAVQAVQPDLIILGIMMPDTDGSEVCRQLKANPLYQEIPVLFISTLDRLLDYIITFQLGISNCITKPFKVEEFLATIDRQLIEPTLKLPQAIAKLFNLALQDPLTGLANQVLFLERLEQAIVQSKSDTDYQFAVLFLDIDNFKKINDNLGHNLGD